MQLMLSRDTGSRGDAAKWAASVLRDWVEHETPMILVQERVPDETLLVYHTLHTPHQTSDPGMWETDAYLAQHVAQLNAAGRHVAQSQQFHVIDIEAMAAQVSQGSLLVDTTHPGPDFMMQVHACLSSEITCIFT